MLVVKGRKFRTNRAPSSIPLPTSTSSNLNFIHVSSRPYILSIHELAAGPCFAGRGPRLAAKSERALFPPSFPPSELTLFSFLQRTCIRSIFPLELMEEIFTYCDKQTFVNLCRVSYSCCQEAVRELYRDVVLDSDVALLHFFTSVSLPRPVSFFTLPSVLSFSNFSRLCLLPSALPPSRLSPSRRPLNLPHPNSRPHCHPCYSRLRTRTGADYLPLSRSKRYQLAPSSSSSVNDRPPRQPHHLRPLLQRPLLRLLDLLPPSLQPRTRTLLVGRYGGAQSSSKTPLHRNPSHPLLAPVDSPQRGLLRRLASSRSSRPHEGFYQLSLHGYQQSYHHSHPPPSTGSSVSDQTTI